MATVPVCSDFAAQENKICHCFHFSPLCLPCSDVTGCQDSNFLNVELQTFKYTCIINYSIINYSHILYLPSSGLITGSLYLLIPFTYINSYFLKKLHLLSYHLLSHCSSLSKFSAPTFLSRPCLFPLHPFHILSFHILLDNWNSSIVLFRSFWLLPLLDSRLLVYILLCRMIVSNSVWPHRLQPTRLRCPWDSPGKNTGVGCHFLLQCMEVKSESEVPQLCPTLRDPMDYHGSSVHGIFQAKVLEWGAIDVYCCHSSLESMVVYSMGVFASTFQCLSIVYTCTSLKHETLALSPGSQSIPPTLSLAFQKCWIKSTNQTSTLNFKTDFWCTGGSKTFGEKGNSFVFWFLGD